MTLDTIEVTDYLRSHFPPYVITEDTTVKPFKHYFRKEGISWIRIPNPSATANPKTSGWYEAARNHFEEYRHHCDSIKVNNIGILSQFLAAWMAGDNLNHPGFPEWTLPRELNGIDWSLNFHDTRFEDVVGSTPVPPFAVSFHTNLLTVENAHRLVFAITRYFHALTNDPNAIELIETVYDPRNYIDDRPYLVIPTYKDFGYEFYRDQLGSTTRTEDTYTLASLWARTDWRQTFMLMQEVLKLLKRYNSLGMIGDDRVTAWEQLLERFDNSARTMAHIAKLVGSTVIVNAQQFEEKLVSNVPPTITVDGTTMYRLAFQRQLVAGAKYGRLASDWDGNVEIIDVNQVFDPTAQFIGLDLPTTGDIPGNLTVPYHHVQNGNIWYTSVPFTS